MTANERELKEVLKELSTGSIQLPDFQRDWVWDDDRIKSLIISVVNNYPIGAVMFLQTGGEINFSYRLFTGVDSTSNTPENLVLDGQQRLTSLLNSMYLKSAVPTQTPQGKKIKRYYYFNLNEINKDYIDWDKALIGVNENRKITSNFGKDVETDLSTKELEYENGCCPVNLIFDEIAFANWRNEYQTYYQKNNDIETLIEHVKIIQTFENKVRNNVLKYHVPIIILAKDTPKEAVCQVFENVNTGGVALNVFELVTAIFASDGYKLREDWENRKKKFNDPKLKVLSSVTATDFLTALTLYTKYLAHSKDNSIAILCKKKNVLELKREDYIQYADTIENAFVETAKFLNEMCIYSSRDLPYSTQLIPLCATIAALNDRFHYQDTKSKLKKWFWCGVFGELYGGANETRYALDIAGLTDWILNNSNDAPNTVQRANFDPCRLVSLQTRNSAAYKGIMALIMKNAKDFISGSNMDLTYFIDENIDIHHIFPKDYCLKNAIGIKNDKWNSIINKTPLSAKSNRNIGGKAPSIYLSKIEKNIQSADLNNNLLSHYIDVDDIRNDNFDDYFVKRAKAILKLIQEAMGRNIVGLDSESVIELYGEKLN